MFLLTNFFVSYKLIFENIWFVFCTSDFTEITVLFTFNILSSSV